MATSLCKCFSTTLHNSHSSKHTFTFTFTSFLPLSTLNCDINSCMKRSHAISLQTHCIHNSSAETQDFRHINESNSEILKEDVRKRVVNDGKTVKSSNLGEKNDVFSRLNSIFSAETVKFSDDGEIVKGNVGKRVKNDGKKVKSGERFNLGEINENSDENNDVFSSLNRKFSAETIKFRGNSEVVEGKDGRRVKDDGKKENSSERFNLEKMEKGKNVDVVLRNNGDNSSFEQSLFYSNAENLNKNGGKRVVDDSERVKNGEKNNLGKINEKGNNDNAVVIHNSENSIFRQSFFYSNGENLTEKGGKSVVDDSIRVNSERFNLGERNYKGNGISSSSDERAGFHRGRKRENSNADSGWSREYGSKNYGKSGGRNDFWKRSDMGDGVSSLKSRGSNENRDRKGDRVSVVIKDGKFDNGGKQKRKERKSKKEKADSPEFQLRIGLDMCSKMGDVMGAISIYDTAVKEGVKMGQYQYTVMLYLCSSASMGVMRPGKSGNRSRSVDKVVSNDSEEEEDDDDLGEKLEVNEIRVSDDLKKYALEKGFEVYERMCSEKIQMNEATLTSVARMAMAMGDGDMAFNMVKEMKSMGISPKLRSYSPALSVFSNNRELEKAFDVEKHMLENGVYLEEPELEALLRVSIQSEKADKVYYVLHELRTNVRSVSPSTAELIEKWFSSRYASRIGKRKWDAELLARTMENVGGGWHGLGWLGSGKWAVSRTTIGSDGLCKCCGGKLALIDLDPEETDKFAESVASIAIKRDKNFSFQKFQGWLDYYGPFEAVVDAANVGLFRQRKFNPSRVNAVVNGIRQMLPSKKWPLIILHNRRVTGGKMGEPMNKAVVDKWINADALYATPTGSNDDWYWLYAAIKFKCLLVTNDEMRDHTFQLLGNDFFPKWKERHQVRFSFSEIGPVFHMPPPCSVVIQESDRGFWHVPIASEQQSEGDRIWLCISRPKLLVMQKDSEEVNLGA